MADLQVHPHTHQLVCALHAVLDRHRRGERDLGDLAGHLLDSGLEIVSGHHLVEQPPPPGGAPAHSVGANNNQSMVRCQFISSHGSIMVCPPGSPRLWASGIWKYASSDATQKSVSRPR